nr:MAG TPA: hypothetical protein [Caudoviricetes sp.]
MQIRSLKSKKNFYKICVMVSSYIFWFIYICIRSGFSFLYQHVILLIFI